MHQKGSLTGESCCTELLGGGGCVSEGGETFGQMSLQVGHSSFLGDIDDVGDFDIVET